jgi:hypothetical protein
MGGRLARMNRNYFYNITTNTTRFVIARERL